jgi:hypothetical protein
VPEGWLGPVLVAEATPEAPLPTCPQGEALPVYAGFDAEGGCSACTCDTTCSPGLAGLFFSSDDCTGVGMDWLQQLECDDLVTTVTSVILSAPLLSCDSGGGTPAWPAPSWDTAAQLCPAPVLDNVCELDARCVATPGAGFEARACIWQAAVTACPAGFGEPRTYYQAYSDTRACTPCFCAPSEPCGVDTVLYTSEACVGWSASFQNVAMACYPTDPLEVKSARAEITDPGSCTPVGGNLTGNAAPSDPVTVCCVP